MSEAMDKVRDRVEAVGSQIKEDRGDRFMCQCPAHEDNNPSLEVKDKGGTIILACYAGCQVEQIVEQLGLEMRDLFESEPDKDRAIPVRSYEYRLSNGEPWMIVDRYWPKTFRQRLPGTEPGDKGGIKGRDPILYRAPELRRALLSGEAVVWLVEGEKDVHTAEKHGLLATTAPGGAGARWEQRYSDFLGRAKEVVIVVDQDEIKADGSLGVGQQHGLAARAGLRAKNVPVRVVAPGAGKDLSDHFAAGLTVDDFVPEATAYTRPRGMTASALAAASFKAAQWAVAGIIPAGVTVLAAPPKIGKSWLALEICLAVAYGGRALGGQLPTNLGSSIYLAREDNYRRLQQRVNYVMGGDPPPKKCELVPSEQEWPGGEQGLANLTEWAEEVRDPRLVVIDTIVMVEPEMGGGGGRGGNVYTDNYGMVSRYKNWAEAHNCAVVMVHHDSKPQGIQKWCHDTGEDPFNRISGSRGLTGAADTLLFLETLPRTIEGYLHVKGRDVAAQTLELRKAGALWTCMDRPEEV